MKKIKGSLSAIRMSHLVIFFAVVAVGATGLRTYQLLSGSVNQETGLYDVMDFTVPLLYGLLAVSGVLFLVLSFLSKNVPAPKLPEGRNIPLGLASIIAVAGFVFDVMIILRDILPGMGNVGANNVMNQAAYDNLLVIFTKGNGGLFVILELVFAVLSALYMLVFALSHFEGKATYKKISLLSIAPGCWAMVVLISKLMKAVSFITVSELLFEIVMLVFAMLFFLTFARIVSGAFTVNSMWCTYGCGFPAAIFTAIISIPRGIVLLAGGETISGSDFSFTHLFLTVFIVVYIASTLGAGFKNSIKKFKSVSSIVLPDDDEVVVKTSEANVINVEKQETAVEENFQKKKRFSVADEFKNLSDMSNFFDEEPEAEEIIGKETVQEAVIVENTVEEAVENYEENANEKIDEAFEEISSQSCDSCPAQEGSEEISAEAVEEVSAVLSYDGGEEAFEEIAEEIPCEDLEEVIEPIEEVIEPVEEVIEPIEEVIEPVEDVIEPVEEVTEFDEDEFDFELADIFAEKPVAFVDSQPVEKENAEEISVASENPIEEIEIIEEPEIIEEIAVDTQDSVEIQAEEIPVISEENEEKPFKSGEDFLEFSQMLIDDSDEEYILAEEEKKSELPVSSDMIEKFEIKEEKPKEEKVKKEKVKKEKIKKEKVKKEKVKKEKAPKPKKAFGRKKKDAEDEEPLTIVSLADLRQKKDEE